MPGGRRVHILGDRHDGFRPVPREAERVGLSTPHGLLARRVCTLLSFQRPRRLERRDAPPGRLRQQKKGLSPERPHRSR
jgi:hypothetical protein